MNINVAPNAVKKIAIIGTGTVGASWAASFVSSYSGYNIK